MKHSNQKLNKLCLTKDHFFMQLALFAGRREEPVPQRNTILLALKQLRRLPALKPFRLWLVGSTLDAPRAHSDIDIVLSSAGKTLPTAAEIDQALWIIKESGSDKSPIRVAFDGTYREHGPSLEEEPLLPDSLISGTQLLSPRRMHELLGGKMLSYRMVGRFCIEYSKRAADTNFYPKLPEKQFASGVHKYLRSAAEVLEDERCHLREILLY